jgi:hypothetical protein
MLHSCWPTEFGIYRNAVSPQDNETIKTWVKSKISKGLPDKHGKDIIGDRPADIELADGSVEYNWIARVIKETVQDYLSTANTIYPADQELDVSELFANIIPKFGPGIEEKHNIYMLHNDSLVGDLTVCYYPMIEQGMGGETVFFSPTSQINFDLAQHALKFTPREGDIIIFPSFLLHRVLPYWNEKDPRVSLVCCFNLESDKSDRMGYRSID